MKNPHHIHHGSRATVPVSPTTPGDSKRLLVTRRAAEQVAVTRLASDAAAKSDVTLRIEEATVAAVAATPECDGGPECPLGNCPMDAPMEAEFSAGLRIVRAAPQRCPDCIIHAMLHHTRPRATRLLRLLEARELLNAVDAPSNIAHATTPAEAAVWYDEDRAC